jgi:hypothetical protein
MDMALPTPPPLHGHPLFEPWRDPASGITSHLLRNVVPLQQSFYFTNPSATPDGRYVWFYGAFPPSGDHNHGRILGVADLLCAEIRWFPETQFLDASPFVDPVTAQVYWAAGPEIWRRGPKPADHAVLVNRLPDDWLQGRRPHRLATHLTLRADRAAFAIDPQIGRDWYLGEAPLDGTPLRPWQHFSRCYNHAQFSPVDPDAILIAQDWWRDAATGEHGPIDDRLWLVRRGEAPRPLRPDAPSGNRAHEWWDASGQWVWYVDYQHGTERVEIATGRAETVWPAGTCHSHCDRAGRLLAGDIGTYQWAETGCRVAFFHAGMGREINIANSLPLPAINPGRYHVHPHPQFCAGDRWICYTTTVLGRTTLAIVEVDELLARTS